jgi:GDP-4-dehydro-6-deoxy-D-mannose reductase
VGRPVLVTGANGFAGGHLIDLLRASGEVVFAWTGRKLASSLRLPPATRSVDVLDRAAVEHELASLRPRTVFHCAGLPHVGDSWGTVAATLETNVIGTHHLLEADRRLGLGARILVPGSAAVYRPSTEPLEEDAPLGPQSPYAVSKLAQEQLGLAAAAEGQHVVVTRSFNHVGPRQAPAFAAASFARQIALIEAGQLEPVIRTGNLDALRDITDVRDTVRAYALLAEHGEPGGVYNVCTGRGIVIGDLLQMLCERAQVPVEIRPDPALFRPSDVPAVVGSNHRLVRATGWHPSVTLERTIDDLLQYWRAEVRRRPEAPPRNGSSGQRAIPSA